MCANGANMLHPTKFTYLYSRKEANCYKLLHEDQRKFGNMPDVLLLFHFLSPQILRLKTPTGWVISEETQMSRVV